MSLSQAQSRTPIQGLQRSELPQVMGPSPSMAAQRDSNAQPYHDTIDPWELIGFKQGFQPSPDTDIFKMVLAEGDLPGPDLADPELIENMAQESDSGSVFSPDGEVLMDPDRLSSAQTKVMNDPKLQPRDGKTFCNFATSQTAKDMGNDDLSTVVGTYPGMANQIHDHLGDPSANTTDYANFEHDYSAVSDQQNADISSNGGLVINSTHGANHGHLTTSAGTNAQGQPLVAHVGGGQSKIKGASNAHGKVPDNYATQSTVNAYERGIRPVPGAQIVVNPSAPEACFEPPTEGLDSQTAVEAFYGDRILGCRFPTPEEN